MSTIIPQLHPDHEQAVEQAKAILDGHQDHEIDTIDSIITRLLEAVSISKDGPQSDAARNELEKKRAERLNSLAVTMRICGFPESLASQAAATAKKHGIAAGTRRDVTAAMLQRPGTLGIFSQKISQAPEQFAAYIAACCRWINGSSFAYMPAFSIDENHPFSPRNVGVLVISAAHSVTGFSASRLMSLITTRALSDKRTIITMYGQIENKELLDILLASHGVVEL